MTDILTYQTFITAREFGRNTDAWLSKMIKRAGLKTKYAYGLKARSIAGLIIILEEIAPSGLGRIIKLDYSLRQTLDSPDTDTMSSFHAILFETEEDFLLFRLMYPHLINLDDIMSPR